MKGYSGTAGCSSRVFFYHFSHVEGTRKEGSRFQQISLRMKRKQTDIKQNPNYQKMDKKKKSGYVGDPVLLSRVRQVSPQHVLGDNKSKVDRL